MRMTRVGCGIALACVWGSGLACDLPKLVMIPAADKIGGHEKEVQTQMTAYMAEMRQYVDCVKAELSKDGGNDAPPLVKALLVQRNNVAVAEVNAVVAEYKKSVGVPADKGAAGDKKPQ